jgi:hypothetical protein
MPRAKPTPLSDTLLPVAKGAAAPAPEPGRRRREAPQETRISMTFRIKANTYEDLRRLAFEERVSQQAIVDEALHLLITKRKDGSTVARLHTSMEA